jgi:hypothetical protein
MTKQLITLAVLTSCAADEVRATDKAESVIESGAKGTAEKLATYLEAQGLSLDKAKGTETFDMACEALKVGYRSQFPNRVRFTGKGDKRKAINMELAKMVLDAPDTERVNWHKDSEQKKIWDAMLAFARTKLQRVLIEVFGKAESDGANGGKAKKAPTPDAILAALDAFLESKPAEDLVNNLFDQIATRRKK